MSVEKNKVIVLQAGYSHADTDDISAMRANCSCTLIRCRDGTNVIVDTMTAWDGGHLLSLLATHEMTPDDVNVVVCTHGHSDHIGCNYLFQQARLHIVGACVSQRDLYLDHFGKDKNEQLALDKYGEVVVQRTPGHTLSCVSVVVHNTQLGGTVGVCGDLFERLEDVMNPLIWQNAGSENVNSQCTERRRMAQLCQHIVPGHGPLFTINDDLILKLDDQVRDDSSTINFNG